LPKIKRRPKDDAEQSKLFAAKAREIEADEKDSAADKLMGALAKMKPEPRTAKKKSYRNARSFSRVGVPMNTDSAKLARERDNAMILERLAGVPATPAPAVEPDPSQPCDGGRSAAGSTLRSDRAPRPVGPVLRLVWCASSRE
jgi:hypothetical protein